MGFPFSEVVKVLLVVESTTQRTVMARQLSGLFKRVPPQSLDKVIYILLGELKPEWAGVELGVGEKLAMRALARALGVSTSSVEDMYKRLGDLGEVARRLVQEVRRGKAASTLAAFLGAGARELTVDRVYDTLLKVAQAQGEGSQDLKINLLSSLFSEASPDEAKYIARFVTGRMRLGIADMTILDALADAFKVDRESLERAYNRYPDLGSIAKLIAERGGEALRDIKVTPGVPVQPMLAQRLSTPGEILTKLDGVALCEFKYDGERAQIHRRGDRITIFSRRLENITRAYPDVVNYVKEAIKSDEYIVEGEIVAYDQSTGDFLPFQELMHRRRKYDVEEAMREYPVKLFLFDLIYLNGEDLTDLPLVDRRLKLVEVVEETENVKIADWRILTDVDEVEKFFLEALTGGCEGIICKSVGGDSVYEMGARGWKWIKYKRDYRGEMTDTVDLVVVGGFYGRGKRAGTYGALLMAAYDPKDDLFYTVCKVGSGFTDEDLAKLPQMLEPYRIPHRHPRVVSRMQPDVWFVPALVLEIVGAEITLSPLHTCCLGAVRPDVGLAIRFPRFTGRYRFDKSPEQATTTKELLDMYYRQKKVKSIEGP